ncbi:MAG: hypothetical protein QOE39_663, partial [Bradyrhizobium sp.]|nr:hypothetical protein [Bradyrhizobium sp.]
MVLLDRRKMARGPAACRLRARCGGIDVT